MSSPSFEIHGAAGSPQAPRWDRVDSRSLIRIARRTYFQYLSDTPGSIEPIGVVVALRQQEGRVVLEAPVLLPDEEFVGLELIRGRTSKGRQARNRSGWG
ncbi:MAG: hypothetical protein ACPHAS_07460 [Synechococcus sp.]